MILLWLAACSPKELPAHLQPDLSAARSGPIVLHPTTLADAIEAVVGSDPLVRRVDPNLLDLSEATGTEALRAWIEVALQPSAGTADWQALERAWPGTVAVALARGAQLAELEVALAGSPTEQGDVFVAGALGMAVVDGAPTPPDGRPPLAWIHADPAQARAQARVMGERRVLLGWLDGPDIPLEAVDHAIQPGIHDRLVDMPAGALLVARARGAHDEDAGHRGQEALQRATDMALEHAAADTNKEQASWQAARQAAAAELGAADPVAALLSISRTRLTADAASVTSTSAALVALTAERLLGSCPEGACGGLDRVSTLERAAAWAEGSPARVWQVIALKRALDTLEVTADKPTFALGLPDLADALLGTGGGPIHQALLQQRTPGPATWLALSRAVGAPDATDAETTMKALQAHLVAVCDAALATGPSQAQRTLIERIRKRAAKHS